MSNIKKVIISTQLPDQFLKLGKLLGDKYQMINFPMIDIEYLPFTENLGKTLRNLNQFNWLIFTSMRGIIGFFNLLADNEISIDKLELIKIACIGKATDLELKNYGFQSDYLNPGNTSREFGEYLIKDIIKQSDSILLILGERADDHLQTELQKYCSVNRINVYKTIDIEQVDKLFFKMIKNDQYDLLIFTSPSAFENFAKLGKFNPSKNQFKIASIGQRTTKSIESLGYKVTLTSEKSDLENLAQEIKNKFKVSSF
jgi:uroporphyrinogen-III synthase